ncbi:oxidoreductase [Williamsia sp. CHRR-6]|uniref:oxidoreductase n=1 Tax=Williamsia sp. CHRR-6 TaxID=2835871 RepID=UPI001BDA93A0|nr:oxidoreductase [Williamsia sp. CHRR-6]MBT0567140.1 oxidoreductase [Williamsia sp. CHRR-6]
MSRDPLAGLLHLPGVAAAAASATDAIAAVHRHPVNLRGWLESSTEASWRAAHSSAAIDGVTGALRRDEQVDDPVLAGALRVSLALTGDSLDQLVGVWTRAPLQALAKLHLLAATDLTDDPDVIGRPRADDEVSERLDLLAQLVTGGTRVPAAVVAGVVHGELLALAPFAVANGVVARAAARLVSAATGLDPHTLAVPEVTWLRRIDDYRFAAEGFASGSPDAVAAWLILHCEGLVAGATEARSIADARR